MIRFARPCRARLLASCLFATTLGPTTLWGQDYATTNAFGKRVTVELEPVLGGLVVLDTAPYTLALGVAPASYAHTRNAISATVSLPGLGTLLQTGLLVVEANAAVPTRTQGDAAAEVSNVDLWLTQTLSLLSLTAETIRSEVNVELPCDGAPPSIAASSTLSGAMAGGTLGLGLEIATTPAPNTVLVDAQGIRVVLNRQTVEVEPGNQGARVTVNGLHVSLDNVDVPGVGLLRGEIVVAHSEAYVACYTRTIDEI